MKINMEKANKMSCSHIGLQITANDLRRFYIECLGGEIIEEKELERERAFDIFCISKDIKVIYVRVGNILLELFVHHDETQNSFNHLCIVADDIISIRNQCQKYHYPVIDSNHKFFTKDNNGNTFEILHH